jgi:hypothetical protein
MSSVADISGVVSVEMKKIIIIMRRMSMRKRRETCYWM